MKKRMQDGGYLDRTDIKLFILFLLDELAYPLTEDILTEIIAEDGQVGRFDFVDCLSELTEQGHVLAIHESGKTYYVIDRTGHMVATELQGKLMDTIRERSRRTAMKILSLHLRGAKTHVTFDRREDGQYLVRCNVTERDGVMLDATVSVPTVSEAERIRQEFLSRPEDCYRGILAILTGKVDYFM